MRCCGLSDVLGADGLQMPFGPRSREFNCLMLAIGLFASWQGMICWDENSQHLPPALAGQLIMSETLSAMAYAPILGGEPPPPGLLPGVVMLAGVLWALHV